jgi:hypothetical protein
MAARGHKILWLAEICYDLLRYYMEDGIENCQEWSLQSANQVLLLFGPIENPRWPPVRDTNMYSNIVLKLTRKTEEVSKYTHDTNKDKNNIVIYTWQIKDKL